MRSRRRWRGDSSPAGGSDPAPDNPASAENTRSRTSYAPLTVTSPPNRTVGSNRARQNPWTAVVSADTSGSPAGPVTSRVDLSAVRNARDTASSASCAGAGEAASTRAAATARAALRTRGRRQLPRARHNRMRRLFGLLLIAGHAPVHERDDANGVRD